MLEKAIDFFNNKQFIGQGAGNDIERGVNRV